MSESSKVTPKRVSRVAAVQFMYEMKMMELDSPSEERIQDFVNTYIDQKMSFGFFRKLVNDFQKEADFDGIIEETLEEGRTISNSPPVEICIIKTALAEMIFENTDIPVIINEYVEIAKDFLDQKAAKFINALLDKISKKVERQCLNQA